MKNFRVMIKWSLLGLLLSSSMVVFAQLTPTNYSNQANNSGFSLGIYTLKSIHLESTFQSSDRWSGFGMGLDLTYQFKSGFGVATRLSYRNWDIFDKSNIPLTIGPIYRFPSTSKLVVSIYGGLGPALIWGNDYASIFANSEIGVRLERNVFNNKKLFLGTSFAQGMSFHPDHFEYLEVSIGIRF